MNSANPSRAPRPAVPETSTAKTWPHQSGSHPMRTNVMNLSRREAADRLSDVHNNTAAGSATSPITSIHTVRDDTPESPILVKPKAFSSRQPA